MSEDNTTYEQEEPGTTIAPDATIKARQYRLIGLLLICGILALLIFELPVSFTDQLLTFGGMVLLGTFLLFVATSRTTATQEPVQEEMPPVDTDSVVEETEDTLAESVDKFEQLVQDALQSLPAEFRPYLDNLAILVEDEPDLEALQQAHVPKGYTLLGLYQGTPITDYGHYYSKLPERITIYQGPIERRCQGDPERIRAQVRATVLHELAHHFGIDHDDMPHWIK